MGKSEKEISAVINALIECNVRFALYKSPVKKYYHLVIQNSNRCFGEIQNNRSNTGLLRGLNNVTGFLFAPFNRNSSHPIIIIKPDISIYGLDKIRDFFDSNYFIDCCYNISWNTKHIDNVNRTISKEDYKKTFLLFYEAIKENKLKKLVLSRVEECRVDDNFSIYESFLKASDKYPDMMTFICHTPESGTWLGSTPEKILTIEDGAGCTMALAGTMRQPRADGKNFDGPALFNANWSAKNINEQKIVVDYIKDTLINNNDIYNIEEVGPYTSKAGNLLHLRSDFFFKLNKGANIGELLDTLYPTPAICGLPKREAYDFINKYEGYDRRYYSGIVGWMDDKSVDLYINLRSLEISSGKIYFYAGGGIVESSDIEDEWHETALKINTMRSVVGINC